MSHGPKLPATLGVITMSNTTPARAIVDAWLRQPDIARNVDLCLDEDGVCVIGHASGIDCVVEVPLDQPTLYLSAPLLPLAALDDGLLRACMSAHLLGRATGGATFAIDLDDDQLVLWRANPIAALDGPGFVAGLVEFFTLASQWRARLAERIVDNGQNDKGTPAGRDVARPAEAFTINERA